MPTLTTPILQANALDFGYHDQKLLSHFTARFPPGITLIRGGDGSGKSTLLRLLAGALPAHSGQLQINGISLQTQAARYKAQVFWTEPRDDAFDQLSVTDYFDYQRRHFAEPAGFDDSILTHVIAGLSLDEHLHKKLFMLSTGSKRKVFMAAAFASGAAVTLLDEPFAALDNISIDFTLRWLEQNAHTGQRAWVIADYVAPPGLSLLQTIDLGA